MEINFAHSTLCAAIELFVSKSTKLMNAGTRADYRVAHKAHKMRTMAPFCCYYCFCHRCYCHYDRLFYVLFPTLFSAIESANRNSSNEMRKRKKKSSFDKQKCVDRVKKSGKKNKSIDTYTEERIKFDRQCAFV